MAKVIDFELSANFCSFFFRNPPSINFKLSIIINSALHKARQAYGVTYYGPCAPLKSEIFYPNFKVKETPKKSSIHISFEEKIQQKNSWSIRTYLTPNGVPLVKGMETFFEKGFVELSLEDQQGKCKALIFT